MSSPRSGEASANERLAVSVQIIPGHVAEAAEEAAVAEDVEHGKVWRGVLSKLACDLSCMVEIVMTQIAVASVLWYTCMLYSKGKSHLSVLLITVIMASWTVDCGLWPMLGRHQGAVMCPNLCNDLAGRPGKHGNNLREQRFQYLMNLII